MKVSLPKDYKNYFTIADLERAKAVISAEKDDCETAKGWAEYAGRALAESKGDWFREILKAEAEVGGNSKCIEWDGFCENSGWFDVWIKFVARTDHGFIIGGAYLSDIWNISSDDKRTYNMFCEYFTEAK